MLKGDLALEKVKNDIEDLHNLDAGIVNVS
jgi:hypothetical protein